MPYGLFDYIPDSNIHTMGLSPLWIPDVNSAEQRIVTKAIPENPTQMIPGGGGNPYTLAIPEDAPGQQMITQATFETNPLPRPPGGGNPYTAAIPEDAPGRVITDMAWGEEPPRATTKAAWGEETPPNIPTPKPPGGGKCPPGYSPVQSPVQQPPSQPPTMITNAKPGGEEPFRSPITLMMGESDPFWVGGGLPASR
jgi:hypothetical protein